MNKADITLESIVMVGALALLAFAGAVANGCTRPKTLEPLGEPVTVEITQEHMIQTLEYRVPTFDAYTCPKHGRVCAVRVIRGKTYCDACVQDLIHEYIGLGE